MKSLGEHLTRYAAYHRDRRNIATHFVGIPMIAVSVIALLARPVFVVAGFTLSPAALFIMGGIAFYVALDLRYGLVMATFMGLSLWTGEWLAAQRTALWLSVALVLFALGWVIQFIGHAFEGKRPALVDDLVGLLLGPLFIVAELGFALGLRTDLRHSIEAKVGPTIIRRAAAVM